MATHNPSDQGRNCGVLFRVSREDREDIRSAAAEHGFDTVQQYLEFRVLGEVKSSGKPGRVPRPQQELLDLSA